MPKPKREVTCLGCQQLKPHKSKGYCLSCYVRLAKPKPTTKFIPLEKVCTKCNQMRPHHGAGLCKTCHASKSNEIRKAQLVQCTTCHELKPKHAKGLCESCWETLRYQRRRTSTYVRPTACSNCGEASTTGRYIRGMCPRCHEGTRARSNGPYITCADCGEFRRHMAHTLCGPCYQRKYDKVRREVICADCGCTRPHAGWGLCSTCFNRANQRVRNAWRRRRYATDPDFRFRAIQVIRKRKRSLVGGHSYDEWQALLELFGFACAYCSKDIRGCASREHFIPVSQGGTNAIENIVPACVSCNSRKHTRSAVEFIQLLHQEQGERERAEHLPDPKG